MRLTVNDVDVQDFGSRRCVVKNFLGDTDGAIKIFHIPQTTTVTTLDPTVSTKTVQMLVPKYHKEQRHNFQQNNNKNKMQRNKSKMDSTQQQQQITLNNMYIGTTSTLWNTYQQDRNSGVREHNNHQVPPDIFDYLTTTHMMVRKGLNLILKSAASSLPVPTIKMRCETGNA